MARVSALSGLNATLPSSFSQISRRICALTGAFSPARVSAAEIARQRSLRVPSGSPMVKRVPSMCLITPGATGSAAGQTTQPTTRSVGMPRATTPPGSTDSRRVPASGPS